LTSTTGRRLPVVSRSASGTGKTGAKLFAAQRPRQFLDALSGFSGHKVAFLFALLGHAPARQGGMATGPYHGPYHEARENDGLMNGSERANEEGGAAKERWYNLKNAGIKYQFDVGCHGASRAEAAEVRGQSKLETSSVRNNPTQWRHQPDVSTFISWNSILTMLARFPLSPSRSLQCCSAIVHALCPYYSFVSIVTPCAAIQFPRD
jgi:hypothetical protein